MNTILKYPNEQIASFVVSSMTKEKTLSCNRMTTGDQYFVYAVKTESSEYVIRMTIADHKQKFLSAIYWQHKLLPLGIPLAEFIQIDLDGEYSKFPALLMKRLPGDDLCNIYSTLTSADKNNLAREMVNIQSAMNSLPDGLYFGITSSYEEKTPDKSWYEFLINRLHLFKDIIQQNGIFDQSHVNNIISIANNMKDELQAISARPFLWDASERNVIVNNGKITGIVDVDDTCFGDPLFVIALTAVSLQLENHDTLYTDYWEEALQLDIHAKKRLAFYKIFYAVVFMRKHTMTTTNNQKILFDTDLLNTIFKKHYEYFLSLNKIQFRNLNTSDVPLLHEWFNETHVQEFYSLRQWTADEVFKKVLPNITGEKPVHSFIVYVCDTPIGYIQYYRLIDFPWPDQSLSDDVISQGAGMDIFIGDTNYLGKGYGKKIMNAFLNEIVWPRFNYCVVDPDIKNKISLQCCEKLGFKKHKIIKTENALGNPAELCLMIKSKQQ